MTEKELFLSNLISGKTLTGYISLSYLHFMWLLPDSVTSLTVMDCKTVGSEMIGEFISYDFPLKPPGPNQGQQGLDTLQQACRNTTKTFAFWSMWLRMITATLAWGPASTEPDGLVWNTTAGAGPVLGEHWFDCKRLMRPEVHLLAHWFVDWRLIPMWCVRVKDWSGLETESWGMKSDMRTHHLLQCFVEGWKQKTWDNCLLMHSRLAGFTTDWAKQGTSLCFFALSQT